MTPNVLGPWSTPDEMRGGGGKAAQLHRLAAAGYHVPQWFCIPAEVFDGFLAGGSANGNPAAWVRHCAEAPLPEALVAMVGEGLERTALADVMVAVRSSGLDEDSAEHSFAGQFESFLYRRGTAQVLDAVRACWASCFAERNLAYRRAAGLNGGEPRMGVIVQRMIDSESAGVAFSRDPLRASDRGSLVIESVWGQGEGLVSGELAADRFVVDRRTLAVQATVAGKVSMRLRDPAGGTRAVAVEPERIHIPSLNEAQIAEVARLALRLEADLGTAQDCEWAFADGRLHVLQSRPITTLPPDGIFDASVNGDTPVVWDNSNIIESFAGVTAPLTFSHVSRCYHEVYRQVCQVSGVPPGVLRQQEPLFRNMLGLIRGRVYYNLLNWYRLLSLFPLLGRSSGFMDTMMGVRQSLPPEVASRFAALEAPRYSVPRRLVVGLTLAWRLAGARRGNAAFLQRINRIYGPLETADLRTHSLPELLALYHRLEDEVLRHWTAPIINDTRCMLAFGTLKALTERWLGGGGGAGSDAGSLQNDLLCGEGDLKSTEPAKALLRIARAVSDDAALRARFLAESPERIWAALESGVAPEIRAAFGDFLTRFGFRCVDELKLEEPDLHERPESVVATVQSYLQRDIPSAESLEAREKQIRAGAERRVRSELSALRRWIYFPVVRWARRAVSDRELLRFERTRTFGVTRRLFRAVGGNLVKLGVLADEDDVFYLTVDEIEAFNEGRSLSLDLRGIAELRRREFDQFRNTSAPPDRFVTRGTVGSGMRFPLLLLESDLLVDVAGPEDPDVMRGTPCCPGVVEGVVLVANRYEDAVGLNGEILVTERTDPGWVTLFPACAGLIIERGSLLSHSAVVARELGIPTVVSVSGKPLSRLRTGDRVRLDAGRGEIRILRQDGAR